MSARHALADQVILRYLQQILSALGSIRLQASRQSRCGFVEDPGGSALGIFKNDAPLGRGCGLVNTGQRHGLSIQQNGMAVSMFQKHRVLWHGLR